MQQVRPNPEAMSARTTRAKAPMIVRTDLSSLLSDYTTSQRRYNDRLESLEREVVSLKGHVDRSATSGEEHELNRTFTTTKKTSVIQPMSARVASPSRIPIPITARRGSGDGKTMVSPSETSPARALPPVPMVRSKTFHNTTAQPSDEANILRTYKAHLEQVLHRDAPPYAEVKVPTYTSVEDVIHANEQLLLENDRLRSELNRLKTESILLLRSMKPTTATTGMEANMGNDRITAERERQGLAMELDRQVEENKRLRKALLVQSSKFLSLRQSTNLTDAASLSTDSQHRLASESAPHSKSARTHVENRRFGRSKTFYHTSHDS